MAFAVIKANEKHALTGGRTFVDMWQGQGAKGFWHAIQSVESNPYRGWPSMVKEGTGWKKALADFTGYDTVAAFYEAFEAHVAPNGVLKTEAELLAFLDTGSLTNAKVNELNVKAPTFVGFKKNLPTSECAASDGSIPGGHVAMLTMVATAVVALMWF